MLYRIIPALFCLGVLSLSGSDSPAKTIDGYDKYTRPDSTKEPTPVTMSVFIIDILDIDDVHGTVILDYFFRQSWKDPRLADENFRNPADKLRLSIDDIWHPGISPVNILDSMVKETLLMIDEQGNVVFRRRLMDTFKEPLDLKRFPFDEQVFHLRFISTADYSKDLDIIWDDERFGHLHEFSLYGWRFNDMNATTDLTPVRTGDELRYTIEGFKLEINLERRYAFYIWKIFVPLGLIAFMAWTVFWIDPANFGGQMAISTSSVITLIAFQLSLTDLMPRVSYLTKIDVFSLGTSIFVFLSLGEAILTARLAKTNRHALGLKIDRRMRLIFPLAYLVLVFFAII